MNTVRIIRILLILVSLSIFHASGQWTQVGLSTNKIVSLGVKSNGYIYAGTYSNGLYRTTDNCKTWSSVLGSTSGVYEVFTIGFDSTGAVLAGTYGAGLFRSVNNGNNWSNLSSDAGTTNLPINDIYSVAVSPAGAIFAVDGTQNNGSIYRSTDLGSSWNRVLFRSDGILTVVANSTGTIFSGGNYWFYCSLNAGDNWTDNGSSSGLKYSPLHLAVNNTGVFAGTSGGSILFTGNNGASWSQRNTNLNNNYITALCASDSTIIAGTLSGGVYVSINNGKNWFLKNSGLTDLSICSLAVRNNIVYVGTASSGVWSIPVSQLIVSALSNENEAAPKIYSFNKNIIINTPYQAKINIFDVFGRLVVSTNLNFGLNEIPLTKTGIYMVNLIGNNEIITRKIFVE